jgi:hypothetical protein
MEPVRRRVLRPYRRSHYQDRRRRHRGGRIKRARAQDPCSRARLPKRAHRRHPANFDAATRRRSGPAVDMVIVAPQRRGPRKCAPSRGVTVGRGHSRGWLTAPAGRWWLPPRTTAPSSTPNRHIGPGPRSRASGAARPRRGLPAVVSLVKDRFEFAPGRMFVGAVAWTVARTYSERRIKKCHNPAPQGTRIPRRHRDHLQFWCST